MVDNRSAGFFGIGGGFNFKSGDISGTAAKTSDDKMGQGTEYFAQNGGEQEQEQEREEFVDRSAQLRSSLDSLAVMNSANIHLQKAQIEAEIKRQVENVKANNDDEKQEKGDNKGSKRKRAAKKESESEMA